MNLFSKLNFFYSRKIEPGFKINKKDLVVDIGSGDKPFWRADVFVDKLSLGNVQRASNTRTIHDLGYFVDSDVSHMPFKTGAFDFSFCSHLLEHVEDPGAVIREITRISRSGYMEIPNGIIETIIPFDSHLWFVFQDNKKLVFVRKSKKLHEVLLSNGKKYEATHSNISEPFIRLYWKKSIEYEIIDPYKESEKFQSKIGESKSHKVPHFDPYLMLVKAVRIFSHKDRPSLELAKMVQK